MNEIERMIELQKLKNKVSEEDRARELRIATDIVMQPSEPTTPTERREMQQSLTHVPNWVYFGFSSVEEYLDAYLDGLE